ncbi:FtsH protease activity modulator HflK [Bradyrhizobium sp. ARR65]|uniref:FtsH protease activity modulator HflK n=1 Tax=Bradyrhizobium sp. ARR65 TaxID=1040989 RepID=UPI00046624D5|nr:FtsH protease activity modulator HflK [Bradyrhizobium sp. ARR65]
MIFAHDQGRTRGQGPRQAAKDPAHGAEVRPRSGYRYWFFGVVLLLLGVYLISGFYVVGADQRAVVRRFGAIEAVVGPGMHYRVPWPVDRLDVVKATNVMKVGVGFTIPTGDSAAPTGMELLTGDTNIVNAALVLQYVVRDPAEFLFQIEDPQSLVEAVAEGVLTDTVVGMPIDEVLTSGRVAVQERVKANTQELLDRWHSGVRIVSASIMSLTLDRSVVQAFQDVADAMADREKVINEARAYASNLIPKARGEARMQRSEAEAYKQQRVADAVGETSRFSALQKEYETAPETSRTRLYMETMEKILPKLQLYIVDSDKGRVPLHLRLTSP